MPEKTIRIPGPGHPIAIEPNVSRVTVTWAGKALADTRHALTLREAKYPAVQYIPRADVDMTRLARSDHTTYCPFKGECSYYTLDGEGEHGINAVWTYETPYPAVAQIKDHLAFYADRVEVREIAK